MSRQMMLVGTLVLCLVIGGPTWAGTYTLDAEGIPLGTHTAYDITTPLGHVYFTGEIQSISSDVDLTAAGSTGQIFDTPGTNDWATLDFGFDVASLTLIYGGNGGSIDIYAYESGGAVLDSFHQDHTEDGYPAGPITLSGNNIRKLSWADLDLYWGTYAPLDNVEVTSSNGAVPELPPVCLAALGLLPLGLKLRRRK